MLTVEKAAQFITEVLNNPAVTVIRQKQDKGSPSKPYVAYRFWGRPLGMSTQSHEDMGATLEETIERKRLLTLEVQFFTQTEQQAITESIVDYIPANDLAVNFQDKVDFNRSRRFQKFNGFSVLAANTILDIDAELGDRWERRALCELNIHTTSRVTEEVEFYNPADLTFDLIIQDL